MLDKNEGPTTNHINTKFHKVESAHLVKYVTR